MNTADILQIILLTIQVITIIVTCMQVSSAKKSMKTTAEQTKLMSNMYAKAQMFNEHLRRMEVQPRVPSNCSDLINYRYHEEKEGWCDDNGNGFVSIYTDDAWLAPGQRLAFDAAVHKMLNNNANKIIGDVVKEKDLS